MRQTKYFRRAKSEWCYAISPAPLGAGLDENFKWCISNAAPGFAEPTIPVCFRRRGDPCGRPKAFPLEGGRWHSEAVTDEGGPGTTESPNGP